MYTHPPKTGRSVPAPLKARRCAGTWDADQESSSVTCQRAVTLWVAGTPDHLLGDGQGEVRKASGEGGM